MAGEDFQAALTEQRRSEGAAPPVTFTMRDEEFTCAPAKLPAWLVLELQATDERHVTESAQAAVNFFKTVVAREDWRRFERVVRDIDDPVDDEELYSAIQSILEAYASRPTRRSSGSADGPSPTGSSSMPTSSTPEVSPPAVRSLHATAPASASPGIPTGRPAQQAG